MEQRDWAGLVGSASGNGRGANMGGGGAPCGRGWGEAWILRFRQQEELTPCPDLGPKRGGRMGRSYGGALPVTGEKLKWLVEPRCREGGASRKLGAVVRFALAKISGERPGQLRRVGGAWLPLGPAPRSCLSLEFLTLSISFASGGTGLRPANLNSCLNSEVKVGVVWDICVEN